MLDTPTQDNYRDFRARYRCTFGWYIDAKYGKLLVVIKDVDEHVVRFSGLQGEEYHAKVGANILFEFSQIAHGWYSSVDGPRLLIRRPQRQWKRGICEENTYLYVNAGNWLQSIPLSLVELNKCFTGKDGYSDGDFVLSKYFACIGNTLYMKDMPVGKREGNVLKLPNTLVHQELSDIVRRNHYPMEITVDNA